MEQDPIRLYPNNDPGTKQLAMSCDTTALCVSVHSAVLVHVDDTPTEICQDKVLLGRRQLAISLNTRRSAEYVHLLIGFLSAEGEPISYQAWCRAWTPAAIRDALRITPNDCTPGLFNLDIDVDGFRDDDGILEQGRFEGRGFDFISGEEALMRATPHRSYRAYEVVQTHPKTPPELKEIIRPGPPPSMRL